MGDLKKLPSVTLCCQIEAGPRVQGSGLVMFVCFVCDLFLARGIEGFRHCVDVGHMVQGVGIEVGLLGHIHYEDIASAMV